MTAKLERVLSGVQPTGQPTLGNYLGAFRQWRTQQQQYESVFLIVDQHALTVEHQPASLREGTLQMAALLFAVGIDPQRSTVVIQSHVPGHSQLAWLMECTATYGELSRMIQFKDKSKGSAMVRAGLFTYPALMAADILLYQTDLVPVGEDQIQHIELARTVATRFNHAYGEVFTLPRSLIPAVAARVMDLGHPEMKMSKSSADGQGNIYLLDSDDQIRRKIAKAKTDLFNEVQYVEDNPERAGVRNLLEILAALTDREPKEVAADFHRYGDLKEATATAVIEQLSPIRERYQYYLADQAQLESWLAVGRERATRLAASTLERAYDAVGFLPIKEVTLAD
ncbi:tryptophan--tRNA ligase [Ferrimicrobium acidiphilum]|uniref:Tryptophan--tRNA ligase n=1 Tax=Ferrimicrobium acidiphilum DSM 19497 TaxID=1121877 RepID=A0A0D8FX80_9ACTN|nr:tryptophan--tRNA ligase [Ferrimicrobium acidiphilum]KJE77873.1 tryptophan--tRNA ligase [Ferrimicrobium acidiphilum DSM 19497]